jgi:hypothetical protein
MPLRSAMVVWTKSSVAPEEQPPMIGDVDEA